MRGNWSECLWFLDSLSHVTVEFVTSLSGIARVLPWRGDKNPFSEHQPNKQPTTKTADTMEEEGDLVLLATPLLSPDSRSFLRVLRFSPFAKPQRYIPSRSTCVGQPCSGLDQPRGCFRVPILKGVQYSRY